MPYSATVFKIFLAAPSDTQIEKKIAREVIEQWNFANSEKSEAVLIAADWESHSFPDTGDNPQAIINRQVLENCDLLIGIFRSRVGSPTQNAESGTIEEIETHIKANKPAMIYFSTAGIDHDTPLNQIERLRTFKGNLPKALYHDFPTPIDFRSDLALHLHHRMNEMLKSACTVQGGRNDGEKIKAVSFHSGDPVIEILRELRRSTHKQVMLVKADGSTFFLVGQRDLNDKADIRYEAELKHAIRKMEDLGLLETDDGSVYTLTKHGFDAIDRMTEQLGPGDSTSPPSSSGPRMIP